MNTTKDTTTTTTTAAQIADKTNGIQSSSSTASLSSEASSSVKSFKTCDKKRRVLSPLGVPVIKVLLLENINSSGVHLLTAAGFQVETHAKALSHDLLQEKIKDVHILGIRSKTQLTADLLQAGKHLIAIGCFCIGTNQVDLKAAAEAGIPVFNSPFSNSRSVAELLIGYLISLARHIGDRNIEMHQGRWNRTGLDENHELRGQTLGIVGYGHIGTQLSILAESMGMKVVFYDILQIMPLGTAQPMPSLASLLQVADFVTLHVPETPLTKGMIGAAELAQMKKGSRLINASRGTVVDLVALEAALASGHLSGVAVDVFPCEPKANGDPWSTPLASYPNVFLTPHIGGSTEEAQCAIGSEVGAALVKFVQTGSSLGSVNFPATDLRLNSTSVARVLHYHRNVPGVLKALNKLLSVFNIEKQICVSKEKYSYLVTDVNVSDDGDINKLSEMVATCMSTVQASIMARVLC